MCSYPQTAAKALPSFNSVTKPRRAPISRNSPQITATGADTTSGSPTQCLQELPSPPSSPPRQEHFSCWKTTSRASLLELLVPEPYLWGSLHLAGFLLYVWCCNYKQHFTAIKKKKKGCFTSKRKVQFCTASLSCSNSTHRCVDQMVYRTPQVTDFPKALE